MFYRQVWDAFVSLAVDPEFVAELFRQANNEQICQRLKSELQGCERQVSKFRQRLDRLIDMRADGEITKDIYQQKTIETQQQLDKAEMKAQELRAELTGTDISQAERVVKAVQSLIGGRTKFSKQQKRSILESIVRRVDVASEKSDQKQTRSQSGHYSKRKGPVWLITAISFQLMLPDENRDLGAPDRNSCLATSS